MLAKQDFTLVQWTHKPLTVRVDHTPFAKGGLRLVYHVQVRKKKGRDNRGNNDFTS